MREDDARRVLLVRAIELEDRSGNLLTEEDRRQADLAARSSLTKGNRKTEGIYLARRATVAATRATTRFPAIGRALALSRWPRWIGWAVPLTALIAGMLVNELGNGRRLDLIAAPFIGTVLWNIAVYLWLALWPLKKRKSRPRPPGLTRLLTWLAGFGQRHKDRSTPMARSLARFARDWGEASAPLALARATRTLHLGAACFALGLIASLYVRALAVEYRAGWESTFLGAAEVHALLSSLLGPASLATGIAIPPVAGIAALRWTEGAGSGGDAAPWIHLFTATALGIVVIPRLLLAGWQAIRAYRLAAWFPLPGREDFYIRRLVRSADGTPLSVRVTSYAYQPAPEVKERLKALVTEALGDRVRLHFDEPVSYGSEDHWLGQATLRPDDDYHLLLFALSATPEAENHGRLAHALRERLAGDRNGTVLAAILDESGFRRQFAGQGNLEQRVAARREAWESVLAGAGIAPLAMDLTGMEETAAQRLEAALIQDPGLEG